MFFKKKQEPAKERTIADTLFGDLPMDYWATIGSENVPWTLFQEAKRQLDKGNEGEAIHVLATITSLPALESRHYVQAYHFLAALGVLPPTDIKVFGIVVEVGMPDGVDLLAAYADHSARYYNFSGRSIVWDADDDTINKKIDAVISDAVGIVRQIGPWKEARRPAPANGIARISFLTSHGLHFGEASQTVLFNDPLSKNMMYGVLDLRDALINKTTGGQD